MANQLKNLESGAQGSTIDLDVYFRVNQTGTLIDPDITPTYKIYDPTNVLQASGNGVQLSTGHWHIVWSIPSNATISSLWKIEWTATINGVVSVSSENFSVTAIGNISFGSEIVVDPMVMRRIKSALGSIDDLLLTDDEIKEICILPAMQRYFMKFPVTYSEQFNITNEYTYNFYNDVTYGVLDCRVVGKRGIADASFFDLARYQAIYGQDRWNRSYKTPYNYNELRQANMLKIMEYDTMSNINTFKYKVDYTNRQLYVYSSIPAQVAITWAMYSNAFADIRYTYQLDVIDLCKANLLNTFADATGIMTDVAVEKTINVSDIRSRAEKLENDVLEKWKEIPDIILARAN